jgi:glycerophosphoryl diester phosphodiesterase
MAVVQIPFPEGPRPRNIGHRGAAGHAPENTLPSFRKALELGADVLELDVHATRDGTIVVCHDEALDRTTDGGGGLRGKMYSEVAKLDAGFHWTPDGKTHPFRGQGVRVPTLLELLESFPGVPLNIEIKQADPPIVDLVGRGATGFSLGDVLAFMDAHANGRLSEYTPPGAALQVPERWREVEVVNRAFVEGAHRCGVEVHVWTVNERADMDRLLALGVDGLVSDYPERAHAAIERSSRERARL